MSKNDLTTAEISLNGSTLKRFNFIHISQPFSSHHAFEVSLTAEMLDTQVVKLKDLTEKWMGEAATITLQKGTLDTASAKIAPRQKHTFVGVVTSVQLVKGQGDTTSVLIAGVSPTVVLNAGRTTRSLSDKSLADIVNNVLSPFGDLKKKVSPSFSGSIPYQTQYAETNYQFLQRLAQTYGEWMYYDGTEFVFGKNGRSTPPTIDLVHGANLFGMIYNLKTTSLNFNPHYYDYESDKVYEAASPGEQINGLQAFAKVALSKSEKLFGDDLVDISLQGYNSTGAIKQATNKWKSERSNHLALMTGQTTEIELKVGGLISVKEDVYYNGRKQETIDYGTLLITQLTHYTDTSGTYYNTFEAIPQETSFPPVDYQPISPQAKAQPAVVTDVNDEQQMGRVKVQFSWQQADNETTPWVRVAQPMSNAKKGVFFLPEKDDVVFVDFELGNPDLPFVRGSMYHGQAKPGELFKQDNTIKGIITRGGNHIIIDDESGHESIKIYNQDNKNEIILSLDGDTTITIKSEGKVNIEAQDTISLKAKTIEITADQEWKVKAGKTEIKNDQSIDITANTEANIKSTNVKVTGDANVDIEANATATLKAKTLVDIESNAMTIVKGMPVMIN